MPRKLEHPNSQNSWFRNRRLAAGLTPTELWQMAAAHVRLTASLTFSCRSSSPALQLALRVRRLSNAAERTCLCGLVVGVV
jgi:hypothetical protein